MKYFMINKLFKNIRKLIDSHLTFARVIVVGVYVLCLVFYSSEVLKDNHPFGWTLHECEEIALLIELPLLFLFFGYLLKWKYSILFFLLTLGFWYCLNTIIQIPIERICLKNSLYQVAVVSAKNHIRGNVKSGNPSHYYICINDGKSEKRISKETYNDINIGDTIIIQASKKFPHIYSVYDWEPTHEEINKYMVPRPVINDVEQTISDDSIKYLRSIIMSKMAEKREQESLKKKREEQIKEAEIKQYYKQLGYIFKKNSRGITKQFNTMVYFGKEKAKQWKLERSMFENINVGDTLLLEFSDENEDYCKVISWHPTPEEKELYRTQVQKRK